MRIFRTIVKKTLLTVPKQKNGNIICMKFFVRGFCNKACNRAHKLTPEEEKTLTHLSTNVINHIFNKGQRRPQLHIDPSSAPPGHNNTPYNSAQQEIYDGPTSIAKTKKTKPNKPQTS
jgi:hypothetical protein